MDWNRHEIRLQYMLLDLFENVIQFWSNKQRSSLLRSVHGLLWKVKAETIWSITVLTRAGRASVCGIH